MKINYRTRNLAISLISPLVLLSGIYLVDTLEKKAEEEKFRGLSPKVEQVKVDESMKDYSWSKISSRKYTFEDRTPYEKRRDMGLTTTLENAENNFWLYSPYRLKK